ncbi:MAG: N-acetylmuramoyl-L-alanine amidase [Alphaproteobacteria bacterium]|nr:N-acetylmuramoyl-L-alanine amidase [Alphaproteobacteria bacterium]
MAPSDGDGGKRIGSVKARAARCARSALLVLAVGMACSRGSDPAAAQESAAPPPLRPIEGRDGRVPAGSPSGAPGPQIAAGPSISEGPRFALPTLFHQARAGAPLTVQGIRIGVHEAVTRFVIDLDRAPDYRVFTLLDPYRVIVDLPEANWRIDDLRPQGDLLRELRYGLFQPGNSRLVIEVHKPVKVTHAYSLPPEFGKPWRLILDLQQITHSQYVTQIGRTLVSSATDAAGRRGQSNARVVDVPPIVQQPPLASPVPPSSAAAPLPQAQLQPQSPAPAYAVDGRGPRNLGTIPAPAAEQPRPAQGRQSQPDPPVQIATLPGARVSGPGPRDGPRDRKVVVIDAGHGGADSGAIGVGGTLEKDITLAMAREVRDLLARTGRYSVVMVRDSDQFVRLRDRVAMARQAGAELFISIHADSMRIAQVRGLSIYTLSERASDREAEELAEAENKADLIGGHDLMEESPEVVNILFDLTMRETMKLSRNFANLVVESVRGQDLAVLPKPHRSAGFVVLKAHDVPSVLVELGYLTNAREERMLRTQEHRGRIAKAIVTAVDRFFGKKR